MTAWTAEQGELKDFWKWLLALNFAAIGRLLYYMWWFSITWVEFQSSWHWGYALYQKWGLFPYLIGVGDVLVLFIAFGVPYILAFIPYVIYGYTVEKRLGPFANMAMNFTSFLVAAFLRFIMWEILWWFLTGRFPIQDA